MWNLERRQHRIAGNQHVSCSRQRYTIHKCSFTLKGCLCLFSSLGLHFSLGHRLSVVHRRSPVRGRLPRPFVARTFLWGFTPAVWKYMAEAAILVKETLRINLSRRTRSPGTETQRSRADADFHILGTPKSARGWPHGVLPTPHCKGAVHGRCNRVV